MMAFSNHYGCELEPGNILELDILRGSIKSFADLWKLVLFNLCVLLYRLACVCGARCSVTYRIAHAIPIVENVLRQGFVDCKPSLDALEYHALDVFDILACFVLWLQSH